MVLFLLITQISTADFTGKTGTTDRHVKGLFIYFSYGLAGQSKSRQHRGKDISLGLVITLLTIYNRGMSRFILFIFVQFR
jgi:hypothetical protein